jgi:hypothetical protein
LASFHIGPGPLRNGLKVQSPLNHTFLLLMRIKSFIVISMKINYINYVILFLLSKLMSVRPTRCAQTGGAQLTGSRASGHPTCKAGGGTPGFSTHPCFPSALPPSHITIVEAGWRAAGLHTDGAGNKRVKGVFTPSHSSAAPRLRACAFPWPSPSCVWTHRAAAGVTRGLRSRIDGCA